MALGRPVFSSSVDTDDHLPAYVTDGRSTTRWSSDYSDNQWIAIDLGNVFSLQRIALNLEAVRFSFTERHHASAYGLLTTDAALIWVINRDYSDAFVTRQVQRNMRNGVENPTEDIVFPTVEDATLVIEGLRSGEYDMEF